MGDLGNRMKMYEKQGIERFIPLIPVMVRLDGKAFHTFCKNLSKPYDENMMKIMEETTKELVKISNACLGYTQSDEITLVFYSDNIKSKIFFDGKFQKIISVLSSMTTYYFNKFKDLYLPEKKDDIAFFDCRAWQLPINEVANAIIWREQDAVKNSVSMATNHLFGHKKCMNKNGSQKQDMLHSVGINWNEYPIHFKKGIYIQKQQKFRQFTYEEIDKLPEKHDAKYNPWLVIKRNDIIKIDMPVFTTITNKNDVIFNGIKPLTSE